MHTISYNDDLCVFRHQLCLSSAIQFSSFPVLYEFSLSCFTRLVTLLATLLNFGALSAPIKVDDTISTLLASVLNDQVKKPTPYVPWSSEQRIKVYSNYVLSYEHRDDSYMEFFCFCLSITQGIFPSYIHVNFHGDEVQHFARKYDIFDYFRSLLTLSIKSITMFLILTFPKNRKITSNFFLFYTLSFQTK